MKTAFMMQMKIKKASGTTSLFPDSRVVSNMTSDRC